MNSKDSVSLKGLEPLVFLAAVAIQAALTVAYLPSAFELVRTGVTNVLSALVWLTGLACLYTAAMRMALKRSAGSFLLALATACLAFAAVKLAWPYPPSLIAAFGAGTAAIGWFLVQPWSLGKGHDGSSRSQRDG